MKRIAIFAIALILVATVTIAQEAQDEPMYVSLTYIRVNAGMEQAFVAALADHLEWHKSINDTHYYNVSQVMTGPRSGQFTWSAGPLTGAQLDDLNSFDEDFADWVARGGMNLVAGAETIVLRTLPQFGNPPPPGTYTSMVQVTELSLDHAKINGFMEALGKLDEAQKAAGPSDDYFAWVTPVSGTSFAKRWVVGWLDSWADANNADPEQQAKVMEAAGGEEAFQELVATLMGAVVDSQVVTYRNLPNLSFRPDGQ